MAAYQIVFTPSALPQLAALDELVVLVIKIGHRSDVYRAR